METIIKINKDNLLSENHSVLTINGFIEAKNINIKMNTIKYNCNKCKDTGQIKFKTIDELSHYSWIPWETRKCEYCVVLNKINKV